MKGMLPMRLTATRLNKLLTNFAMPPVTSRKLKVFYKLGSEYFFTCSKPGTPPKVNKLKHAASHQKRDTGKLQTENGWMRVQASRWIAESGSWLNTSIAVGSNRVHPPTSVFTVYVSTTSLSVFFSLILKVRRALKNGRQAEAHVSYKMVDPVNENPGSPSLLSVMINLANNRVKHEIAPHLVRHEHMRL